jgi:protein lifeguard
MILIMMTFIGIFWYNEVLDMVLCSLGVVIFSFLIIYDTSLMMHRLSPEEYISAALSLYLDIINLFLYFLRIFSR